MARTFDISNKINTKNPTLKLDKDHVYVINTEKNTVLKFHELQQKAQTQAEAGFDVDREILDLLLGKENAEELEDYLQALPQYAANKQAVMLAVMAGVANITYDEMEERFRKQQ